MTKARDIHSGCRLPACFLYIEDIIIWSGCVYRSCESKGLVFTAGQLFCSSSFPVYFNLIWYLRPASSRPWENYFLIPIFFWRKTPPVESFPVSLEPWTRFSKIIDLKVEIGFCQKMIDNETLREQVMIAQFQGATGCTREQARQLLLAARWEFQV